MRPPPELIQRPAKDEREVGRLPQKRFAGGGIWCVHDQRENQAAGIKSIRVTAKANTAKAKTAEENRTRGCSNFPAVPAKKSTVAKSTVLARYWPERLPEARAVVSCWRASARASPLRRRRGPGKVSGQMDAGRRQGFRMASQPAMLHRPFSRRAGNARRKNSRAAGCRLFCAARSCMNIAA